MNDKEISHRRTINKITTNIVTNTKQGIKEKKTCLARTNHWTGGQKKLNSLESMRARTLAEK
tara:strand:- start:421 stop:606 length:186 start_codon:yes stop_codon:yes gene_type:complete